MSTFLVIGALALDRPIRLDRPLQSGARLRGRSLEGALEGRLGGGAANAGCALLAAGHAVRVASVIADDADGARTHALALAAGLDLTGVRRRPGTSARTLVLLEPTGERTIIGLDGALPATPPQLDPPAARPGPPADGVFVRAAFGGAAEWARSARGPVVLHWPAPGYDGEADVVVASAEDLPEGLSDSPFATAAAQLGERLAWIVVTHGAAGAVAHARDGARLAAQAPPVAVRDATGAGDVFAAGLLEALAAGAPMPQALAHACAWGAIAATLDGSAPVAPPRGAFRRWAP
ncbi:PfkB family carbohydrate kinase [Caulobacter sp. KR2-114]|uniref:PfkB family carbohydrate kinase n=1 Tax=Caulobacter sp. KR2-114 TaxID=3400912 RepID=UPI003C097873